MSQPDQGQDHRVHEQSNARVQFPLDANSYKIVAEIGAGVSTIVYKALCLPLNSAPVAIKSIDLDQPTRRGRRTSSSSGPTSDVIDNVRREAKMMSLLSHPNILNAHCSFTVGRRLWVVMPFMSAGSLHSILSSSSPGGLPEPAIAPILRDILLALSYLHSQGHLHRDIKAGNILLDSHGSVKLADFGVSASLHDSPLTDLAGTPYWMAPEVFHSLNGYGTKADIWSFGITALELAHGRPPLSHLPLSKSLVMKITKRFLFSDYENSGGGGENVNKKFSKAFKEMVGMCLNQDPAKRPTAERLLKHSFFKNCSKGLEFLVRNVLQGLPSVEERFRVLKSSSGGDREDCDEGLKEKKRRISGWNFNEDGFELDPVFPTESGDESAGEIVKEGELNPSLLSQGGELRVLSRSSPADQDPSWPSQGNELCDASELTEVSPGSKPGGQVGESDEPTQSELGESDPSSPSQTLDHPEPANLNSPSEQADTPAESSPSEFCESAPSWATQGESTPSQGEVDRERVLRDLLLLRRSIETERATLAEILRLIGVADQAEAPSTREAYLEGVAEKARSELEMERKRNSELELEIEFLKMQLQRDDQ